MNRTNLRRKPRAKQTTMPSTKIPTQRPAGDISTLPLRIREVTLPDEPAIRALVEDISNSFKYSFAAAAADIPISNPSPVDLVLREFINSRPRDVRSKHAEKATALLRSPRRFREQTLGRYGSIEPEQYATVGFDGLASLAGPRSGQDLSDAVKRLRNLRLSVPASHAERSQAGTEKSVLVPEVGALMRDEVLGHKFTKLGLFIKEVHCFEETDEIGADEISVGGVIVDADGQTHVIDQFVVSDDFDEGESVLYPPPQLPKPLFDALKKDPQAIQKAFAAAYAQPGRKFGEWKIRRDLGWPTAYAATIVIAEKDDGGFWKFLRELAKKIVEALERELKMGLGAAAGLGIGAAIGGVWGALVGAVVGFVVGALWDLFSQDNPDDIVGQAPLVMSFGASSMSYYQWTGLLKQPHPDLFPIDFKGDGGHYRVWCYYQLYK
jgi:hypothetical protein